MVMQLKSQACKSTRAIGQRFIGTWSVALLCGSVTFACSGTIDTPTGEYPARQADTAAGGTSSSTPSSSNSTASAGTSSTPPRTPAAADDDPPAAADDDPPAAADEDPPADEVPAGGATELAFEADIWPIFNTSCGPCHVSGGSGGQNIGSEDIPTALSDAKDFEDGVIREIESGGMPLGCGKPPGGGGNCVSEDDFQAIQDWYAAGAPE
jgi:hypothetical protein